MFVVRYVALLSLVIWMSTMSSDVTGSRPASIVPFVCGGLLLASLLTLKFVGPPPRSFVARAAIVVVMLGVAALGVYRHSATEASELNLLLGCVPLSWYARE